MGRRAKKAPVRNIPDPSLCPNESNRIESS